MDVFIYLHTHIQTYTLHILKNPLYNKIKTHKKGKYVAFFFSPHCLLFSGKKEFERNNYNYNFE